MKTIIAGSRTISSPLYLEKALECCPWKITAVVSGGAQGVDQLGEAWAYKNNIPVTMYLPEWEEHGKKAGFVRNIQMAQNAEALLAVWDGESKGTKHMIDVARAHNLKVFIFSLQQPPIFNL
jgi:hypothetical protein